MPDKKKYKYITAKDGTKYRQEGRDASGVWYKLKSEDDADRAGAKRSSRSLAKPKPKSKAKSKPKPTGVKTRTRTTTRKAPASSGIHKAVAKKATPTKPPGSSVRSRSRTTMSTPKARRWTPAGARAHKSRGGTK